MTAPDSNLKLAGQILEELSSREGTIAPSLLVVVGRFHDLHPGTSPELRQQRLGPFQVFFVDQPDRRQGVLGHRHPATQAEEMFVVQNNHFRGQAVANALQLKQMMQGGTPEAPEELVAAYPELSTQVRFKRRKLF